MTFFTEDDDGLAVGYLTRLVAEKFLSTQASSLLATSRWPLQRRSRRGPAVRQELNSVDVGKRTLRSLFRRVDRGRSNDIGNPEVFLGP